MPGTPSNYPPGVSGNEPEITGGPDPTNMWDCPSCGETVYRFRSEATVTCVCGTQFNASGQRLRDDWADNPSNWDDEIGDLEGFEMQHGGDA